MNKKTHKQWLEDKDTIIKGMTIGILQAEKGSITLRDMAYGAISSLLEYDTHDRMYLELVDLCGSLEIQEDGVNDLNDPVFIELKKIVTKHARKYLQTI